MADIRSARRRPIVNIGRPLAFSRTKRPKRVRIRDEGIDASWSERRLILYNKFVTRLSAVKTFPIEAFKSECERWMAEHHCENSDDCHQSIEAFSNIGNLYISEVCGCARICIRDKIIKMWVCQDKDVKP
jgi:hypothetical protein